MIWLLGVEWDKALPSDLIDIWKAWRKETFFFLDDKYPIARYYYFPAKELNIQLHGFCDSSQAALAGVVYIWATYADTSVSTALVAAKSMVAPVKSLTIPKLELCSAVLLSKLLSTVRAELKIELQDVYAWSDSTISLGWINTLPHPLTTYAAIGSFPLLITSQLVNGGI